ncbi:MAG: zinc metallopeptidase [Turicibacter sp.]
MPIGGMYGFSSDYIIYLLIALIIPMIAQGKLTSTFNKYSQIRASSGLTGGEVARRILDMNGLNHVHLTEVNGRLSDHYDPTRKVVRLSADIYRGTSIASVAVAAHECGHAIQHANGYAALKFRSAMFPLVNISNKFGYLAIMLGFFLSPKFLLLGIILVGITVLFQLVTLPVEFNASSRALTQLGEMHILHSGEEKAGAKAVLTAAAFTYVAGAVVAIAELLRLIMIFNRNND